MALEYGEAAVTFGKVLDFFLFLCSGIKLGDIFFLAKFLDEASLTFLGVFLTSLQT